MTCICAIHAGGVTWIGSDQRSVVGNGTPFDCGPKWTIGKYGAIATAGPIMFSAIVERHKRLLVDQVNDEHTLSTALRDLAKGADCHPQDKDRYFPDYGFEGIYATRSGVWVISDSLAFEKASDFWAAGSGGAVARGAYWACAHLHEPSACMALAIEAACNLDIYCGGPPWVHRLE